jgi:sugar/nucleoside kinase (ribokinase family)
MQPPAPRDGAATRPDILAIGAVLWDIIGRTDRAMPQAAPGQPGADVPGRITRLPGGVALNAALALARFGLRPALLSAVGRDSAGADLIAACGAAGLDTRFLHRPAQLGTDSYMAIEAGGQLVAAIADAATLEAAGGRILDPLRDGRLGSAAQPWAGPVVIDGNLTEGLLAQIATDPLFARADIAVAPASPGKAERLRPFLGHPRATLYLNLIEAGLLTGTSPANAAAAARQLIDAGAAAVLVTDGAAPVACGGPAGVLVAPTPAVAAPRRVTGAGDTFMAAHIVAMRAGHDPAAALARAAAAAAAFVAGLNPESADVD